MAPIRFQSPQMPSAAAVEAYFANARAERWFSNRGPCVRELEARLAAYVGGGVEVALASSGTLALMLALRAVRAGQPRNRQLAVMPSYTFIATAAAVCWCGLRPLFADVDADRWHLDPASLEAALTVHGDNVAVVVACSTFGAPPPSATATEWQRFASDHGVPLVVDSAAGFGAEADDGRLGRRGNAEVFSFHATKPFAIGEGGAVVTVDRELAARVRRMANFGFDPEHAVVEPDGLNAKMSELQAAVGLAVSDGFDAVLEARRSHATRMRAALEGTGYRFQAGSERSAWQFVPVLAPDPGIRAAVLAIAATRSIEIRSYYDTPLHRMPTFREAPAVGELAVTEWLSSVALSLPLSNDLNDAESDQIIEVLLTA